MQQYNNDIENKLRQLENQQLPDLSAMDAHWKAMQATLSPGIVVPRRTSLLKKYLLAAVSIAAIGLIIYFNLREHAGNKVKELEAVNNSNTAAITTNSSLIPMVDSPVKWPMVNLSPKITLQLPKLAVFAMAPQVYADSTAVVKLESSSPVLAPANNAELLLNNFYSSIQKQAQEFIINADKGAELICKEGSKISIPPAAFVDANGSGISGKVTINVTEYYKYSDMIAANLTTTSNGEQLVTGGMIKLTALQNNREVQLRNDKSLNLTMPTNNYDADMKLFLADDVRQDNKLLSMTAASTTVDTAMPMSFYRRNLDWAVTHPIQLYTFDGKTNFLNMQDEPVRVRETKRKRVGIFHITNELPMTVEESKQVLKEKYGDYYTVIKVKKIRPERKILFSRAYVIRDHIGDSTRLTVDQAIRWHYIKREDSLFYAYKVKADSARFMKSQYVAWTLNFAGQPKDYFYNNNLTDSLYNLYQERLRTEKAYNFTVKKMGWINCDRFYNYPDKTDFVLDLPGDVEADKFVTQIVFTDIKSVMPGQPHKNQIGFVNIPVNMPVYVVGLGEKNGKVVSFMQPLKTSADAVSIKEFEETTPEAFKEKLKQLDL